ncbi:hypothetical protein WN943_001369 [Citrus x changshan-huyou]
MQDVTLDNKLRLLMIAASIYPEKFEGEKGLNLMKKKRTARKDRSGGEEMWQLSRFYPMMEVNLKFH